MHTLWWITFRKIRKIGTTRRQILSLKCFNLKKRFPLGLRSWPCSGSLRRSPSPLAAFEWAYTTKRRGRERKGRKGRNEKGGKKLDKGKGEEGGKEREGRTEEKEKYISPLLQTFFDHCQWATPKHFLATPMNTEQAYTSLAKQNTKSKLSEVRCTNEQCDSYFIPKRLLVHVSRCRRRHGLRGRMQPTGPGIWDSRVNGCQSACI